MRRGTLAARPTRRTVLLATAAAGAAAAVGGPTTAGPSHAAARSADQASPKGGVNLAGADFGTIPGVHGTDYLYPRPREVDYYGDLGFGLIRLPFKWERLQPRLGEPFAPAEERLLTGIVRHATGRGLEVVLDPHNYAKRRIAEDGWSKEHLIGSGPVSIDAFSDFWSRLARLFAADKRVLFGLMNEPVGLPSDAWLGIANAAIGAIRGTGAENSILVPGVAYTGAHSWISANNTVMGGVIDPLNRFAFDVHQYFDADSSGTRPDAVSGTIGSERIEAFQAWARTHGFKAYLGEFNGGRNPAGYNALHDLCQEMSANPDIWLGWAAWAGGPRWPEAEMFNLEPWKDGRIREQTAILARYARPHAADAWVTDGAAVDLDLARDRIFGVPSLEAALALDAGPGGSGPRSVSDLRDRKGVRFGTPAGDPLSAIPGDALRGLLGGERVTLLVETRELPPTASPLDLMRAGTEPLLRRTAGGAVELLAGELLRTAALPLAQWRFKRRVALTIDRAQGRVGLGVTGQAAVEGRAEMPDAARIVFALGAQASSGGYLVRIVGFPRFTEKADLAALVA
ncbi:hypothetical protein CCR97_02095 [Rhodoplanes elegans]|uniref:Glycoside hydrolase family 5 domain-containing protein n=1 Tax=Rhodoplanes elegans TaxID=29408 RepID=A0A327KHB2_9BRAD|nr:glycoside hydrolase family 5 protein [Rhodoplanes elegans]MBK5957010.1 hypothetical protein [Rhodoplanes elegans]RAI36762.1 hypothetical protein CH338_17105 [Rhodoplanes elegans]